MLGQFRLLCFAQAGSMSSGSMSSLPGFHPSENPLLEPVQLASPFYSTSPAQAKSPVSHFTSHTRSRLRHFPCRCDTLCPHDKQKQNTTSEAQALSTSIRKQNRQMPHHQDANLHQEPRDDVRNSNF